MLIEIILLIAAVYWIGVLIQPKRPKNFPPGPTGLPIVGAGMYLSTLGTTSGEMFMKLGEIWGPVSGTYLGNIRTIIINGYEASKTFYTRDEFIHRPNLFLTSYRWNGRQLGVFFSNGRLWQEQRRFTIRHLRDFGFGKTSMEGLINEESEDCINSIKKALKGAGSTRVIEMNDQFGISVINILVAIMSGARYKHDDEEFKKMLKVIQLSFRAGTPSGNLVNAYPFLRHFPYFKQQFEDLTSGSDAIIEMLKGEIADHAKTRDPSAKPRDLIDVYLKAMEESKDDPNSTFSIDQLTQICQDLFAAGAESTSNSIAFAVLHMIRNPKCQEKVHKELDSVIGRDRLPSFDDKASLPYTFATITEAFRMSPVAPVSVPHFTIEDTEFMGFHIPKNTWAMVNFTSSNMDKAFWKDPETFRPERFLDAEGKFIKSSADRVLGFGAGKRQCLGEPLARMSNYLLFTAVMQHFKFEVPDGQPEPSIEPVEGFTVAPQPFSAKVTVRF